MSGTPSTRTDAPRRLPHRARDRERLGHAEAAIGDQHRGPFVGDVFGALHADPPPRLEHGAQHGDEVGVEAPLVDDVGPVDAPS